MKLPSSLDKSTKIVATIGPASFDQSVIRSLMLAGVNVFRLNFSHGSYDEKIRSIKRIRHLSKALHQYVAIIADLQGPKFRLGETEDHQPIDLETGQSIFFTSGEQSASSGNFGKVSSNRYCTKEQLITGTAHAHTLVPHLREGHRILINDGAVVLQVEERIVSNNSQSNKQSASDPNPQHIKLKCKVLVGGPCGERKGVNVPDIEVPMPALTEKDKADARFALAQGVEFMALSFVQRAQDVHDLREFIQQEAEILIKSNGQPNNQATQRSPRILPRIISKIEKPQALLAIDSIIEASDCIMVARGDLGVEASYWSVPSAQKMLIQKCSLAKKPVIVATQMLESMIENASPTRAEVSDVFNAVLDGADATMLSGESAAGKHPVVAVQTMAQIVRTAEKHLANRNVCQANPLASDSSTLLDPSGSSYCSLDSSIAYACVAATMSPSTIPSSSTPVSALILVTVNFEFPLFVSKLRPRCPIIVVTFDEKLAAMIDLLYGCHTIVIDESNTQATNHPDAYPSTDAFLPIIERSIESKEWLNANDVIVLACADAPFLGLKHSLSMAKFGSWKQAVRQKWSSILEQHLQSKL